MKTARLFKNGPSQAVRLPKEFRLDTAEVFIHRSGDTLILTPRMATWDGFAAGLSGFSPDFTVAGGLEADAARTPFA